MCMHVPPVYPCVEVRGQHQSPPMLLSTLFLRLGLSLNTEYKNLAKLAGQAPEVLFASPLLELQPYSPYFLFRCWGSKPRSSCRLPTELSPQTPRTGILTFFCTTELLEILWSPWAPSQNYDFICRTLNMKDYKETNLMLIKMFSEL